MRGDKHMRNRQFGVNMGGLMVATLLTLLALPAMYAAWFRVPRPEKA